MIVALLTRYFSFEGTLFNLVWLDQGRVVVLVDSTVLGDSPSVDWKQQVVRGVTPKPKIRILKKI
jgi:hypothetical protein